MDIKTKEALCGSIQKWINIIENGGEDEGQDNCPLCELFNPWSWTPEEGIEDCEGCPVYAKTGHIYCRCTPYSDWVWCTPPNRRYVHSPESKAAAIDELEFLISLYPEGD